MNATLQVKRDNKHMTMLVRDTSTGQLLVTIDVDWMAIGNSIQNGGLGEIPANCQATIHAVRTDAPTRTERTTHLVQCPELPDDKLYPEDRTRMLNEVLRPYEIEGWKAVPGQLGNRDRIKRALPGGGYMYDVEFVRHTYETPAPAEAPAEKEHMHSPTAGWPQP